MNLNKLTAISPIDGRYRKKTQDLAPYFSEYGLIKYRVKVEIEYFIALCELPLPQLKDVNPDLFSKLRDVYVSFSEDDAQKIKDIEKETNHDVKAVEYFIKEKFTELGLEPHKEFVHFGLTSQDVNNTATPLSLKEGMLQVLLPEFEELHNALISIADQWRNIPMLARTHGQPASPTKLGKEIRVFATRLKNQLEQFKSVQFSAKFGGATGNFNAHYVAYPDIDWNDFAEKFVNEKLGLSRSYPTTQIEHYDNLAGFFHALSRINTVLIDFSRDIWQYISINYFKQRIKKGEVGSSAMPHKVNPIDFENAEGNLGMANSFCEHLASKLPISRMQRDLTDSTVLRNIGVPLSHTLIALQSLLKGIDKITVNQQAIDHDLKENWIVVSEALQTILRREGFKNPYEILKDLTRKNEKITQATFIEFIDGLDIDESLKEEMKNITPWSYTGME
jgi:adenylosuccinate lyase